MNHKAPVLRQMKLGQYYWDGLCVPQASSEFCTAAFSVGIFQCVPTKTGTYSPGVKRGKSICRVKGFTNKANAVFERADKICAELNNLDRSMTVGAMTVGATTVGAMTVGAMTVGAHNFNLKKVYDLRREK